MRKLFLLSGIVVMLALAGCGQKTTPAVQAVEGYYQAMVDRDDPRFIGYTCADWEEQALLEFDSFQGVDTQLDSFSCKETGKDGDVTLVRCVGKILATYGNEKMDFPLDERVHRVVNEAGDLRVCGY